MRTLAFTKTFLMRNIEKATEAMTRHLRPLRRKLPRIAYDLCAITLLVVVAVAAERYRDTHEAATVAATQIQLNAAEEITPSAATPVPSVAPLSPAGAERIGAFCVRPRWDEAMGAWIAHTGVDYRYPLGEPVLCLASGTITAIEDGGADGAVVEVCVDGALWRYGSLTNIAALSVDSEISCGERIGIPGCTRPDEAHAGAHLHLEIIENDRVLDPASILQTAD